jgi:hypothetical protein
MTVSPKKHHPNVFSDLVSVTEVSDYPVQFGAFRAAIHQPAFPAYRR